MLGEASRMKVKRDVIESAVAVPDVETNRD